MTHNLSLATVKKIAALARLGISDQEAEAARQDLAAILSNFAAVQKIDTSGVPTSDDVTGLTNITQADQAAADSLCPSSALLERAPATQRRYVKVQAVF